MILRYLLLTALRDRLFAVMLLALVAIWLLAVFAGGTSIVEDAQAAAAFAAFGARLLVVLGMVLFVALHVRRLLDSRELHLLLSRPLARPRFVITYWASFALVALGLSLAAGVAVWGTGPAVLDPTGLAAWTATLALEAAVMTAFALFVALGLTSAIASVLAAAGFYVLARMLGVLLAITRSELHPGGAFGDWMGGAVSALAMLLPRLDRFAPGTWPVHGLGDASGLGLVAVQGVLYTALLVAASVFDFNRRAL